MNQRLRSRTALVTGSTSNIGKAIALLFAAEGAYVIVSGRDSTRGQAVVDQIRASGGSADFVWADLDGTQPASQRLAADAAAVAGRPIDILVNNAGIFPNGPTTSVDEEAFDRVYAVNVKAPFFLTAAIAPGMMERHDGVIINMGSWIARLGLAGSALYSSTKGAMETLTRAWSAEFGPHGVRVNAISPGVVRESDEAAADSPRGELLMQGTPYGASGRPDAIARAALYLASDDSQFVDGTVLDVDGGRTGVGVSRI